MDAKSISHGGGHSKIELCDILTSDGKYIHIKKNSSSAMLSHLFNQALVSAQLVIEDNSFVEKANIKINEETDNKDFLINNNDKPTVIMAIISQTDEERPRIPFFSKMALKHVYHRLKTSDCKVYIKNIQEIQCEDDK